MDQVGFAAPPREHAYHHRIRHGRRAGSGRLAATKFLSLLPASSPCTRNGPAQKCVVTRVGARVLARHHPERDRAAVSFFVYQRIDASAIFVPNYSNEAGVFVSFIAEFYDDLPS